MIRCHIVGETSNNNNVSNLKTFEGKYFYKCGKINFAKVKNIYIFKKCLKSIVKKYLLKWEIAILCQSNIIDLIIFRNIF